MARVQKIRIQLKAWKLGRQFFARPCDDGRKPNGSWCVEEIEVRPDLTIAWASTFYAPALISRGLKEQPKSMTKAQAKLEARMMTQHYNDKYVRQQGAAA